VGYVKIIDNVLKNEESKYPYPVSYMVFYLCDVLYEEDFDGNDDTHGRVWLDPKDFINTEWCIKNKVLLSEVLKLIKLN
jgi:hypothetical protein